MPDQSDSSPPDLSDSIALPSFSTAKQVDRPSAVPTIPIAAPKKRKRRKSAAPDQGGNAERWPNGQPGPEPTITPAIVEEILGYIGTGAYTEISVIGAGIDLTAHYVKMRTDPEYRRAIVKARAYAEIQMGARVSTGKTGYRGALKVLERTRPERWAPRAFISLERDRLGEMSDGELAGLLPLARRALTDAQRNEDANTIKMAQSGPGGEFEAED